MQNKITIGKSEAGSVELDVGRLIKTRLLVTANSGGGKSWLLRLLFEQLGKSTPLIVLDREGEFVTLREKLDVVLVGPQGEVPTDTRSAGLLCRRLMERQLSAVIDMSELPLSRQRAYVKAFLDTLIELPKELWRPTFVGLDETHLFAPEKGAGEAESLESVINLATLGRKRGFSFIGATQRISKLHKDAAAELLNKFVGRTALDIDQKRAADELGMNAAEARTVLRELSPIGKEGEYYGFGPAMVTPGVTRFRVGKVSTTHPEAGQGKVLEPPKPSKTIVAVLSELQDLPKQAEAEIRDMTAAKQKIAALERELKNAERSPAAVKQSTDQSKLVATQNQTIKRLRVGLEEAMKVIAEINSKSFESAGVDPEQIRKAIETAAVQIVKLAETGIARKQLEFDRLRKESAALLSKLQKLLTNEDVTVKVDVKHNEPFTVAESELSDRVSEIKTINGELTKPRQKILDTIRILDRRGITATRDCVARWMAIHPNGGSYGANLGFLRSAGYLDNFTLTETGIALANLQPTGLAAAVAALPDDPKKNLLKTVDANGPMTRDDLAAKLEIHPNGGSYGANLGWLRTMGLITPKGAIALTDGARR